MIVPNFVFDDSMIDRVHNLFSPPTIPPLMPLYSLAYFVRFPRQCRPIHPPTSCYSSDIAALFTRLLRAIPPPMPPYYTGYSPVPRQFRRIHPPYTSCYSPGAAALFTHPRRRAIPPALPAYSATAIILLFGRHSALPVEAGRPGDRGRRAFRRRQRAEYRADDLPDARLRGARSAADRARPHDRRHHPLPRPLHAGQSITSASLFWE